MSGQRFDNCVGIEYPYTIAYDRILLFGCQDGSGDTKIAAVGKSTYDGNSMVAYLIYVIKEEIDLFNESAVIEAVDKTKGTENHDRSREKGVHDMKQITAE